MTVEQALLVVSKLSLADKLRLIERILPDFEQAVAIEKSVPKRSLYGLCADLGSAPSEEDIAEMRHEAWANFGREDMF